MANNNPTQPNVGFIPSNPEHRQSPTPNPDKTPIPPPPSFAAVPRFPPPILHLQKDQATPHSNGSPVPHLSTPPGPPVFTTPVRPAAVPFRTSPASPQPLALSSASSLPTSSPPHYTNRSSDLQPQVSDSIEDHISLGESSFVLFSAHKVNSAFILIHNHDMKSYIELLFDKLYIFMTKLLLRFFNLFQCNKLVFFCFTD